MALQKIQEIIPGFNPFTGEKVPSVKEQQEAFEKGTKGEFYPRKEISVLWIKKLISKKDWNGHYQYLGSWCPLADNSEGVWVSSVIVSDYLPDGCFIINDEEARKVDDFRKTKNIALSPLKEVKVEVEEKEINVNKLF